jgi:hypothetical protein
MSVSGLPLITYDQRKVQEICSLICGVHIRAVVARVSVRLTVFDARLDVRVGRVDKPV